MITRSIINRGVRHRFIHMGRVVPELNDSIRKSIDDDEVNPKSLINRRNLSRSDLPVKLEFAAKKVIKKYEDRIFRTEVLELKSALYNYKAPDDKYTLKEKINNIRTEVLLRDLTGKHAPNLQSDLVEDQLVGKLQMKRLLDTKLERQRRDWHYLEYDDRTSALYMAARLAPNYAVIKTVMDEIKIMDDQFKPTTVLDFGSGMGTTMWAVNETWLNTANEFLNVDISKSQHELAEALLRGGTERGPNIPGVFFRNYLPVSHLVKYDLVVAAFSLLDLPSYENRITMIENLWHKTNDMMVIIERGNLDGFKCVAEARHFLLNLSGHKISERLEASGEFKPQVSVRKPTCHVLSPCPHEHICPRLQMSSKQDRDTCNFSINYEPLEVGMRRGRIHNEKFSYAILRKGPHQSFFSDNDCKPRWPRIIEKRTKGTKHISQKICCPNGHIAEIIFTKRRHGSAMYKVAKSCDLGDLLPIEIRDEYVKKERKSSEQRGREE